jgi:predicted porin
MNKRLLAVAVSAALVAPAVAMADVMVYGAAQVEVADVDYENKEKDDGIRMADRSRGRVGIKASEDLGNGLKGIAQFEWKADTTDNETGQIADADGGGSFALSGRVAQVGLAGNFGTVVLGNLKSPYKYTGGVKYDPFVATLLQARGNGSMTGGALGHNSFVDNLVAYASPKGPVTASIGYGPSEDDGLVALDVKYSEGGIEAFIAYVDAGDRLNGGMAGDDSDYTAAKIGGQFKSGGHKISAQYEDVEITDEGGAKTDPSVFFLGYQFMMDKNTFAIQYGETDHDMSDTDNTTYVALGAIHKFSKTTRVFGGWRDTSTDKDMDAGESVITVGLRKDFKS